VNAACGQQFLGVCLKPWCLCVPLGSALGTERFGGMPVIQVPWVRDVDGATSLGFREIVNCSCYLPKKVDIGRSMDLGLAVADSSN